MKFVLVTLLLVTGLIPSAGAQAQQGKVELISKFKHNTLMDISPDGSLLLLYGGSTPKKEVKAGVVEWKMKRGDDHFDILRVVEWQSGRELAAIHAHRVPGAAHFTGDGKQVCYLAEKEKSLWDYTSGQTGTCTPDREQGAYRGSDQKYQSPDGKLMLETVKENVRQFLVWTYVRGVVTIANRSTGENLTVPHPTVREPLDWPLTGYVYSAGFTPDNQHLITSYENDTYIWRLKI